MGSDGDRNAGKDSASDGGGVPDSSSPPSHPGRPNRRGVVGGAVAGSGAATILAFLSSCRGGSAPGAAPAGAAAAEALAFGRRLKAAFVNTGLANSWPAQGKAATEQWGKWLGVDVTWYDGGLSIDKQRAAVDDIATKTWDFVAIQAFGIDTLLDPVSQLIKQGIPVIQMDTVIAKDDPGITTFLEPDNVAMSETVTETLFKAIGGKGSVIMTQGALGHSGARKRGEGFRRALARHPDIKLLAEDSADWDVNKTVKLWEDYLVKFPRIDAAFFHSDDMALAASRVIKNAGREVKLGSVDAMPEAIEAVKDGRLLVSVRNSSVRIHWGAMVIGAMAATGVKDIPKYIQIDGPVVTKEIAAGMAFMESHFLL